MGHIRPGSRPRTAEDAGTDRHAACWARSTTAPAAARPGARGSPARRTSTSTSAAMRRDSCRWPPNYKALWHRPRPAYGWSRHFDDRFDLDKEPNEPNRFGWVVEIDPYDPQRVAGEAHRARPLQARRLHLGWPRTAASSSIQRRRRAFRICLQVRHRRPGTPTTGRQQGPAGRGHALRRALQCRRHGRWLPLVHGQGPLTAENGFASQADVLIEAAPRRRPPRPTPMDRPEDIETNPVNGRVYVVLTNNGMRKSEQVDPGQPARQPTTTAISSRSSRPGGKTTGPRRVGCAGLSSCCRQARRACRARSYHRETRKTAGWLPRQHRLRQQGPHLDRHRRRAEAAGVADGL